MVPSDSYSGLATKIAIHQSKAFINGPLTFGGKEDGVEVQNIIDFEKMIGKKVVWALF